MSKGIAEEGRREGKILGAIEVLRDLGMDDNEIVAKIVSKYNLTETQAKTYMTEAQTAVVSV